MVSVEHLTFHYDNDPPVLRDLSLTIRSGAITTLMGANGCGKSTLLQILTKNLKPDSGTIRFDQAELPPSRSKNLPGELPSSTKRTQRPMI